MDHDQQSDPQSRLPFIAEGCSTSQLENIRLASPPTRFRFTPECLAGLVHLTAEDGQTRKTLSLGPEGEFKTEFPYQVSYDSVSASNRPCFTIFEVRLEGKIHCSVSGNGSAQGASVVATWSEKTSDRESPQARGCPSTAPCLFKTASELRCGQI